MGNFKILSARKAGGRAQDFTETFSFDFSIIAGFATKRRFRQCVGSERKRNNDIFLYKIELIKKSETCIDSLVRFRVETRLRFLAKSSYFNILDRIS